MWSVEDTVDALFHNFGRVFCVWYMGVSGDNIDLDGGDIVGNAFKFVVSDKLMDGETAVGI